MGFLIPPRRCKGGRACGDAARDSAREINALISAAAGSPGSGDVRRYQTHAPVFGEYFSRLFDSVQSGYCRTAHHRILFVWPLQ